MSTKVELLTDYDRVMSEVIEKDNVSEEARVAFLKRGHKEKELMAFWAYVNLTKSLVEISNASFAKKANFMRIYIKYCLNSKWRWGGVTEREVQQRAERLGVSRKSASVKQLRSSFPCYHLTEYEAIRIRQEKKVPEMYDPEFPDKDLLFENVRYILKHIIDIDF